MQFRIYQNDAATWGIAPTSGRFEGQVIATAEGVNLKGVKFSARSAIGTIKALWGASIALSEVYDDPYTLRALRLGRSFDVDLEEKLVPDFDGFLDTANHLCRTARRIVAIGTSMYAKEAV